MTCEHMYSRSMAQELPRRCLKCGHPEVATPATELTRFELEQELLDCWKITDDIELLHTAEANAADFAALATVYEFKFQQLWNTFEALIRNGKLT